MKNFLKKFKGKPLNDEKVAIGMHYCFCNAKDLYEEAKLLKKNKRYSRVFGLLILSLEELSKIAILLNTVFYSKDDDKKWNAFWKSFNTHSHKQIVWSFYGKNLEKYFNNYSFKDRYPPGLQPLLEKGKQLCFYVNFFDNDFIKPGDFAKDNIEWLNWIIEFTEKRIKSFSNLHSSLDKSKVIVKSTKKIFNLLKNNRSEAELKLSLVDIIKNTRNEFRKFSDIES
jgi:AbiV family abortive infection protein